MTGRTILDNIALYRPWSRCKKGAEVRGTIECEAARVNGMFDGIFVSQHSLHVSLFCLVCCLCPTIHMRTRCWKSPLALSLTVFVFYPSTRENGGTCIGVSCMNSSRWRVIRQALYATMDLARSTRSAFERRHSRRQPPRPAIALIVASTTFRQ